MKNPQSTFRLRICFFTVQEQESPQVGLIILESLADETLSDLTFGRVCLRSGLLKHVWQFSR